LVTETGPLAPAVAPPTEIPGPKFACVDPTANVVYCPVIVTEIDCPCCALFGDTDAMEAAGFTVNDDELRLLNVLPVVVAPEIVTT
jgi:hypothetical protein